MEDIHKHLFRSETCERHRLERFQLHIQKSLGEKGCGKIELRLSAQSIVKDSGDWSKIAAQDNYAVSSRKYC
jgi:hypothetical protein